MPVMELMTGKSSSKVAPAENSANLDNPTRTTTPPVGGTDVMLTPKKSDSVCVEMPECNQDQENNPSSQQEGSTPPPTEGNTNVKPSQSYDSYEEVCRICHDNPSKLELISPCLCKGSMSKVHRTCLERWLGESAKNSCEICGYEYNTVRKPKYTGCRSIVQWIRHPLSPSDTRNLFFDIACFFILTPLAAISSWLCVVGAQHYTFGEERRRRSKYHDPAWMVHGRPDPRVDASNATWTSVGLLSLTGTLLVAYSVWLFVAVKYHIQAWRDWQQRNFTVTIVPFEDGCMGRPPPPRPPRSSQSNTAGNNNNSNSLHVGERGSSSNGANNNPSNFFGTSGGFSYDIGASSYLRYSGHNSVSRGRGRSLVRNGSTWSRPRETYLNLPPIFSRSHFLRNPPPGYTISETALLYQALYGNDSDAYLNENFLAFFADSSEDVTESSSMTLMNQRTPSNGDTETEVPPPPPIQISESLTDVHETKSCLVNNISAPVPSTSTDNDNTPSKIENNNERVTVENEKSSVEPQPSKSTSLLPMNANNANNDTVIRIENEEEKEKDGDEIV